MSDLTLQPVWGPFTSTFSPPGSKSLTNRALVLAALSDGICELRNVLFADDTHVMLSSLRKLGFKLEVQREQATVRVHGRAGTIPATEAELFCGNSGTTIRFLTGLCALGKGSYTLDGIPRMRQRPIGELVDLLRNLGVRIQYLIEEGFPPIRIDADGLPGGMLRFGAAKSSQFLSAVLMASPYARHEVQVDLESGQTSWPYISMTMQLMDRFHVTPELYRDPDTREPRRIFIPRERYRAQVWTIEPDASNASYFLAAAALHPGSKVTIEHLGSSSLQGDVGFADVLRKMGAQVQVDRGSITVAGTERLEGIDTDLHDMPDMAQTLAVTALFARGKTIIRGLHTLRHKETDRLAALATELGKFGAGVKIEEESLYIDPPDRPTAPVAIDTYDDHRMAMSFSLAGTKLAGVTIRDIECVNKTYPEYFDDLRALLGQTARG